MNEPDTEFALESERNLMPQKKQRIDLSDPNLSSLILRLAIPSVVGLSIHALQQVVNAIFVGALGVQAIAAVSMTLPIMVLLAAAGQGIGVGTASFISRHLGAREYLEASRGASTALALTAPTGIIVTVALLPSLPAIFATLGATPTIMPVALDYAGTLLFGNTLMLLNIVQRVHCQSRRRYAIQHVGDAYRVSTERCA
ncbi:Na+-driven multidrug efflux pump [Bradyrhizobium sp. LM2.7]